MKIDGDSNKSYPSMAAHPQISQYSVIMHQILHFFEKDIS